MNSKILRVLVAGVLSLGLGALVFPLHAGARSLTVTRATLKNGLRVVVVHDPLAPVVTTMLNYEVGSDDQPIAGLAHATEHMMFRGSKTLSSSQLMDTIGVTGGSFDADTQNQITQYFFTVPSQYLDIALHLERSRATGLEMAQSQWNQERKAITQEVTQDNSNAFYRLFVKMQTALLAGTPYAKNGLGTVYDFAHTINHPQLIKFYDKWYHPNNAVYVIVGDVNGPATVREVAHLFGNIPAAKLPARAPVVLHPITAHVYHDTSDQPFTAVLLGYRMPGYDSKYYAAGQILADVLNSPRGNLYGLAASGKALGTQFQEQSYPKASVGIGAVIVPVTTKPEVADAMARAVIAQYRKTGIPAGLVAAAKRREIAQLEFNGNSIQNLAFQWSQAVAVQGLRSPDAMIAAYRAVTPAAVDRVLREDLQNSKAIAAYAVPKNLGKMSAGGPGGMQKENNQIPPTKHEPLPSWAQHVLAHLRVPEQTLHPVAMMLPNGIKLIVQPESVTPTVVVSGEILNNPQVQEPRGQDGVADLTASLFPYGTTTYGRIAYQRQLDKIAASVDAGTSFSLQVLAHDFGRGVQLLADDELHPRFSAKDFAIVKQQDVGALTGEMTSPNHLASVALANALYPMGDPQRRFATPKSASGITLADVKAWFHSAYRPDLTTIVVVGDVTPAQAKAQIERYFGGWKAVGPKPQVYPGPVPANKPSDVSVPATGRVQSSVQLVETVGLLRNNPDWAPMQVADTVLTGGFYSSLLYHDLREVHGYVYYVGSELAAGKVRSTFSIDYGSDPQNVIPAEQLALRDVRTLQRRPISATRLIRAKALLMGEVPIAEASYGGVGSLLLQYGTLGMPLDENLIDARRELAVTAQSMRAALAKWVRTDGFVRVITGPGPK